MRRKISLMVALFLAVTAAWAQEGTGPVPALVGPTGGDDRMVTPTPVSNQGYSMSFAVEEPRSNYLDGAITFGGGYDDNIFMSTPSVHDMSYSLSPSIDLQQSRSLLRWDLNYSPQFTFYQNHSSYNELGHNLFASAEYRLSPYVTLTLKDSFIRTSNMLGQLYQNATSGTTSSTPPPDSIIAPLADRLSNAATAEITYQFSRNGMVGASGSFSELQYPNSQQALGLFDSSAKGGSAFYTHRLSGRHYVGASYSYQNFVANPGNSVTQSNSVILFYTLFLNASSSVAVFAGPQHSATQLARLTPFAMWSPAAGVSFGWQGSHTAFSASVSRRVSEGGGLPEAVLSESADAALRRQLTRTCTVALSAAYAQNTFLQTLASSGTGGYTFSMNASVSRSLGQHLKLEFSYTRAQQNYGALGAAAASTNRNRAWLSFAYQFEHPLGR